MQTKPLSDTDPNTERLYMALIRTVPSWRKAEMVGQMFETMKQLALVGLRQRYPQANETEFRRGLAEILLGSDLAQKAYGPLAELEKNHLA